MTTTTTTTPGPTSEFTIPVAPVPASRPRVPRFGKPYYVGRYKTFREAVRGWVAKAHLRTHRVPLECSVTFVCKRPAKPANPFPIGDIDNYLKAVWDGLNGHAFTDDKQIHTVYAVKRFTRPGEDPHIHIILTEVHP